MIRFMRCFIWVLGIVVMGSDTCLAGTFSPLPSELKVGQNWTYLVLSEQLDTGSEAVLDTSIDTLAISVVGLRKINDQTYFVLNDSEGRSGLYRVDGWRKTWKYNVEKGTEDICWDLWRPPFHPSNGEYVRYDPNDEEVVVRGDPIFPDDVERFGPYELHEFALLGGSYPFFSLYPDSKYGFPEPNMWLDNLLSWEATPLYSFSMRVYESIQFLVIAPNFGVILYYIGSWEFDFVYILLSYKLEGIEQNDTGIKNISFGELKEQIKQRIKE